MPRKKQSCPTFLKALGRKPFPRSIELATGRYALQQVFKHDFFAATGLLKRCDGHQVVLKVGRQADILGMPAAWIGVFLTRREARIYRSLTGVAGVPAFVGMCGQNAFVHEFVPGHPLRKGEVVADGFFAQLEELIRSMHARRLAYVDLEKRENVIVGDDRRPYLIDFQISWDAPSGRLKRVWPATWLCRKLQHMDLYHLLKHRRRHRPDQLAPEQQDGSREVPFYIRLHRAVVAPLQGLRRGLLRKLDPEYR